MTRKGKSNKDEISVSDYFRAIDLDANVIEELVDGRKRTVLGRDFQGFAYLTYRLVDEALNSNEPAYRRVIGRNGRERFEPLPLGRYLEMMPALTRCYYDDYRHSEHVELFMECCKQMGLIGLDWDFGRHPYARSIINPEKLELEEFNDVIELLRKEAKKPEFKERARQRERNCRNNFMSGKKHLDAWFEACARLMVNRIDLSYALEHADSITEEQSLADLGRFLNNRRGKPKIFADLKSYVIKREWGAEKGFHFHLIFYFDGSREHKDAYKGEEIGEYWKKITGGKGEFFNCNDCKNKYKRLGIGMINHFDTEMRNNLLIAMKYLTKKEQFVHATKLTSRVFRKGEYPAPRTSRAGRPRKERKHVEQQLEGQVSCH